MKQKGMEYTENFLVLRSKIISAKIVSTEDRS